MCTPKCQQLLVIQRLLDDTTCCLEICAPIISTPGILKMALSLGFFNNTATSWERVYTNSYLGSTSLQLKSPEGLYGPELGLHKRGRGDHLGSHGNFDGTRWGHHARDTPNKMELPPNPSVPSGHPVWPGSPSHPGPGGLWQRDEKQGDGTGGLSPPRIGGSIPISLTYLLGWSRSAYLNELSRSG